MQTVNVAVRKRRSDGVPELFFFNSNPRGYWLECYAHVGQHSEASLDYMRRHTVPCKGLDADALALLREWSQLGEPVNARPVARLIPPRG